MSDPGLFDEFSEVSAKQWKQKIQFDLKGADYNEALVWESLEGIKVKPFYNSEDLNGLETYDLPENSSWQIGQSIYAGDPQKANAKAQEILQKGVESLVITIPDEKIDFEALLSKLDLKKVPLHFNFEFLAIEPIKNLLTFLDGKGAKVHLNIDIIGNLAKSGNWYHSLEQDHYLLEEISQLAAGREDVSIMAVDLSLYQNAGANMVQQLAYSLAHANEYLNHFSQSASKGITNSCPITFKVSVGSNYFFEIAKIRALRWLWECLCKEYGIESECHILATPSKRNKTLYDYNVNLLRTTSECMSASPWRG